jgi:flagellar basal-body rod protein FlgG
VLASDQGRVLDPPVRVPENAVQLTIDGTGRVFARIPNQVEPADIGQIQIATFLNPAGLRQIGENLYVDTAASGEPVLGAPAADNRGSLLQGVVEASNVDPTFELIELIRTQRAFEMNSNTIRTADAALQTVSNLRRS